MERAEAGVETAARARTRTPTPRTTIATQSQALNKVKFKQTGDIIQMHMQYPGALGASFLANIRLKTKGLPLKTSDLRDVNVSEWARGKETGVTDPKALREVQTLAAVIDHLNNDMLPQLLDVAER